MTDSRSSIEIFMRCEVDMTIDQLMQNVNHMKQYLSYPLIYAEVSLQNTTLLTALRSQKSGICYEGNTFLRARTSSKKYAAFLFNNHWNRS